MVQDMRLLAIVLLLAVLALLLYLWNKRKDQIHCPECGARVNIYAEQCPHCGHEKGDDMEEHEPAAEATNMEADEEDEPAVDAGEEPEPAAVATADDGQDEIVCDDCGETFDSEHGLKIHNGMKH